MNDEAKEFWCLVLGLSDTATMEEIVEAIREAGGDVKDILSDVSDSLVDATKDFLGVRDLW